MNLKAIFASPQTTYAAILLAIITVLQAVYALIDGNPDTVANWEEVLKFLILAYCAFVGRDAATSDMKAGLYPEK